MFHQKEVQFAYIPSLMSEIKIVSLQLSRKIIKLLHRLLTGGKRIVVGPYGVDLYQHNHSKVSGTMQVYAKENCVMFSAHWLFTLCNFCFLVSRVIVVHCTNLGGK